MITTIKVFPPSPTMEEIVQKCGLKNGQILEPLDVFPAAQALFNEGANIKLEHFPMGNILYVEKCRFIIGK